jgi:hypothetical protein
MTIGAAPVCIQCKHLIIALGPMKCDAFPDGIPDEILWGGNKHTEPFPGDHGIQFKHV